MAKLDDLVNDNKKQLLTELAFLKRLRAIIDDTARLRDECYFGPFKAFKHDIDSLYKHAMNVAQAAYIRIGQTTENTHSFEEFVELKKRDNLDR